MVIDRELPDDLTDVRVLEVRPGDVLDTEEGDFDFVLCRNALRSSPYPMALLADLWRLTAPAGVLLLESDVVAGPEHSQYASFVPSTRSGGGWVPGRLALRWMVEVSGFDVERWLDEAGASGCACLRAVRSDRTPARSAP